MKFPVCGSAASLALALAAGCAPALDWRDVRPEGTGLRLQFPCKPSQARRQLSLAGAPVTMTLQACDADGQTFALAWADLGDPTRVRPALAELAAAAARNVGAAPSEGTPAPPPGATPNDGNRRYQLQGRRPDGSAAQAALRVFAHGSTVFQATVLGAAPAPAAAETFFDSLRIGP